MRDRVARVPLVAVVVGAVLTLASVVLLFVGGRATGVSWDEPYRIGKLVNYLQSGWFVDDVADGQPLDFNAFVYAPVADLFSHAVGVLTGVQQWAEPAVSADAYAARHAAIGLLALVGLAAAATVAGLILGSWRWAVITAALLGSIPLWTGHAMFNASDIPVATGYTLATLGVLLLVRCLGSADGGAPRVRALVGAGAALAAGVTLTVGSRPATWPAMLVTCAVPVLAAPVLVAAGRRRAATLRAAIVAFAALAVAYLTLLLVYPAAFSQPARLLRESVTQSAQFGPQEAQGPERSVLDAAGYVPSWLVIQLPIIVAVLVVAGAVAAAALVWRARRADSRDAGARWRATGVVALAAQILVLPAGAAVMRSTVYDGIRQFLFVIPALAVVATLGLAALITLVTRLPRGAVAAQAAVWVLVAVGVLLPVVDQVGLFPYGYAYVNEASSRTPIDGRLPTDYWRTSMRELIPLVPKQGATSCTFDPLVLGLVPIDCATQGQLSPFWDTRGRAALDVPVSDGSYLFLESNRGRVDPGPGCTILDRVTRILHGQEVTMGYVALCEAPCVVQAAAQCPGKDLSGAVLDGLDLSGSTFTGADFTGTSLILANVSGSSFAQADLSGAILASTNLRDTDLSDANLTGANLTGADLTGANLSGADLTGATLTDVVGYAGPTDGQ